MGTVVIQKELKQVELQEVELLQKSMEVTGSYATTYKDGYSHSITVILNQEDDVNLKMLGKEIIGEYVANELEGMLFSFNENGYPDTLQVSVSKTDEDYENHQNYCTIEYEKTSENPVTYNMDFK